MIADIGSQVNDCGLQVTDKDRLKMYQEALKRVPLVDLNQIEALIREKLNQRTSTGPFQLRKIFKYFDRDASGSIDFSEMRYAFKILGFTFSDWQVLALFARYVVWLWYGNEMGFGACRR